MVKCTSRPSDIIRDFDQRVTGLVSPPLKHADDSARKKGCVERQATYGHYHVIEAHQFGADNGCPGNDRSSLPNRHLSILDQLPGTQSLLKGDR